MRRLLGSVVFISLSLAGCPADEPPAGKPLGRECDEDDVCAEGLECLAIGDIADNNGAPTCVEARFCTKSCVADEDCASLGDGHICVRPCDIVDDGTQDEVGGAGCFEGFTM